MRDNHYLWHSDTLPKRLLTVDACISPQLRFSSDLGELIVREKHDMAMRAAHMILKEKDFFEMREDGQVVRVRLNCVALTVEEWKAFMEEQFMRGYRAGQGMRL